MLKVTAERELDQSKHVFCPDRAPRNLRSEKPGTGSLICWPGGERGLVGGVRVAYVRMISKWEGRTYFPSDPDFRRYIYERYI